MKTLVVHPSDPTTDFLKAIYKDLDCEVIDKKLKELEFRKKLKEAERIIMLGHGAPFGLFGFGGLVINSFHVNLIQNKLNNVYIWCNANKFVERYDLHGFYTGMVISEYLEAVMYSITNIGPDEIRHLNNFYARTIGEVITKEPKLIVEHVKLKYQSEDNQVIQFNNETLYWR